MNPSVVALAVIFGIVVLGSIAAFYAGSCSQDGPGAMDGCGPRFRRNSGRGSYGWRSIHHLCLPWQPAAGLIRRGDPPSDYRLIRFRVRGSVPFLPECLGSRPKIRYADAIGFFIKVIGASRVFVYVRSAGWAVFLILYLQLQVTGLGLIVNVASFEGIDRSTAMIIGIALVAGFVFVSGVRAVAWVSILKDFLMLFAAAFLGIGITYTYFGGIGPMFTALANANPSHLVMPGATKNMGHLWYSLQFSYFFRLLYVAAFVWSSFHREECQHVAPQRGHYALLHYFTAVNLLCRLCLHFDHPRPKQRRLVSSHDSAEDLSSLVSRRDWRSWCNHGDGPCRDPYSHGSHVVC